MTQIVEFKRKAVARVKRIVNAVFFKPPLKPYYVVFTTPWLEGAGWVDVPAYAYEPDVIKDYIVAMVRLEPTSGVTAAIRRTHYTVHQRVYADDAA